MFLDIIVNGNVIINDIHGYDRGLKHDVLKHR